MAWIITESGHLHNNRIDSAFIISIIGVVVLCIRGLQRVPSDGWVHFLFDGLTSCGVWRRRMTVTVFRAYVFPGYVRGKEVTDTSRYS